MLWITPSSSVWLRGAFLLALAWGLAACGSKRSMEGARSDDELASTSGAAARYEGAEEDDTVSFQEKETRVARPAGIRIGNTRSGPGKLSSWTTQAGDTLWKIAERPEIYGAGQLYPLIYKANRDRIRDANNLPEGLVLSIPRDVPDPEIEIALEESMTGQFLDASPLPGATAAAPAQPGPAPVAPASGGGKGWLWALLALGLAGGGFWLWRRRQQAPAAPSESA